MKITTSELKQIIKEEAERFAKIKSLEVEKNKVEKQLNEMYEEADVHETMDETMDENEEVLAEPEMNAPEGGAEGGSDTKEEGLDEGLDEGVIGDFMKKIFSDSAKTKEAKAEIKKYIEKMLDDHQSIPADQKESLKKQAMSVASHIVDKGNSAYKFEPVIRKKEAMAPGDKRLKHAYSGKFYTTGKPETWWIANKAISGDDVGPWRRMFHAIIEPAAAELRSRGMSAPISEDLQETVKVEVEKAIKVEKLKKKANKIIEEMKSL
jgi:hypothetical protein